MAGNPLLFIGGSIAALGVGYYLYKGGYFNSIFDAINKALGGIGNGNDHGDPVKIKCKDGKQGTQAECDSQAKCKSDEHWSPSSKKCVKASNQAIAMAYTTPAFSSGSHRAYLVS